jgi:hypothetical protein
VSLVDIIVDGLCNFVGVLSQALESGTGYSPIVYTLHPVAYVIVYRAYSAGVGAEAVLVLVATGIFSFSKHRWTNLVCS